MNHVQMRYSGAQQALHWTIAVIVFVMVPVGISMANILPDGPAKNTFYELHKSFGIVVFALALIRICVRLWRGAPPLVPGLPEWQRAAAHISHYGLYVLIVAVPLAGWVATSSCCAPVNVFWTVPVTLPVSGEENFAKAVFRVHYALAFTLTGLVLVHAGAALHHHFVRKDATLMRMLPARASAGRERQ